MNEQKRAPKEKWCFGIGAIGKDAIVNLVGAFLMLYLTDTLGIAAGFVGTLFFCCENVGCCQRSCYGYDCG